MTRHFFVSYFATNLLHSANNVNCSLDCDCDLFESNFSKMNYHSRLKWKMLLKASKLLVLITFINTSGFAFLALKTFAN